MRGLVLRVSVLLLTAALVAIPIVTLVETLTTVQLANGGPTAPIPSSQSRPASSINCSTYERGVVIELHQIDVDAGSVTADVWMCLGVNQATEFQRRSEQAGPQPPSLDIAGLASNFSVSLPRLGRLEDETQIQGSPTTTMWPVGEVTLPLQGSPRDYPLDRYTAKIVISETGFCDIGIPTTYLTADPGVDSLDWDNDLSTAVAMIPPAQESRTPGGKVKAACGGTVDTLTISADRPATTKLFVLCLVLVPLLLLALLVIRLSEGTPRSIDGLVGVGAIMLAILPIRTVLVPADIGSLTLVDFALASEMTLLVTGMVAWFAWPSRGPRQR